MNKDKILTAVAKEYGVSEAGIMSGSRIQPLAEARQMAMYLFRREVRMSVTGIARILSRHHTTVTQGVRHIGELMTVDKSVRTHHERITDELKKNT